MRGWLGGLVVLLAMAAGCQREAPVTWPDWTPQSPAATSPGGFKVYLELGHEAERRDPEGVVRVGFTPGQRARSLQRVGPLLVRLKAATRRSVSFVFEPRAPGVPAPGRAGWRLLGRALAWRAEDAAQAKQFDEAIAWAIAGTKFGYDLTGGSALDASLGFAIVGDSRNAISPWLAEMGASQLGRLGDGVARAWMRRPTLQTTVAHELAQMTLAVGTVQDLFRKGELDPVRTWLGPEGRQGIRALERLMPRSPSEQVAFFRDWGAEAHQEASAVLAAGAKPLAKRPPFSRELETGRAWAALSRAFFHGLRPMLGQRDDVSARTQLLALNAQVLRQVKARRLAPTSLAAFGRALSQDPHTGDPFIYQAEGQDFRLYSVGPDLRDNGGESDPSGTSPDIVLSIARP